MKKIKQICVVLGMAMMSTGCGGESVTDEEYQSQLAKALPNAGYMGAIATQPPAPDTKLDLSTIQGVDSDDNGMRDSNERLAWQSLDLIEGVTASDYSQVLNIMASLQPSEEIVPNSIDEHQIRCDYQQLKPEIQKRLTLDIIYLSVLDTQIRRSAFAKSAVPRSAEDIQKPCN
ncbi:hypothetical protein AB6D66_01430 [Vibrio pomeroyi]|uniref:Lipoprotein n=1 Tax=Vibrio pomeroyi TaxID=198832 RepID=A0ABV4MRG7_9VIBR|nr:hypothetical protein [Vibrio atlanticus]MCZ4310214.1 hypothetical protein [Vibrio atlanticus]